MVLRFYRDQCRAEDNNSEKIYNPFKINGLGFEVHRPAKG